MVAVLNQCVTNILEVILLGANTTVTGRTSKINLTDKYFALQLDHIQMYLCLYIHKQRV
jgi:hypothetical protein